ncbi:MAG: peptide ABC transporter substrate-binding protein [Parabacteroides sp.]|nr:peptide ABC transporter substrate-binding protein [Parabacteroides sp.]
MKKLALLLLALLLSLSLVGCGGGDEPTTDGEAKKVLNFNVGFDPDNFDPQASNVLEQSIIITQMYDGLLRETPTGDFECSLASDYTVSDDGLVYTFTLRDGIKFADGSPITAEDVRYSWARALNPENAFEYAYQLYYIQNGAEYNAGECTEEELGIEVVDEKTLVVTLASPAPYFASLTAFTTLQVVSKDFVESQESYGANVDSCLASGPFKPVEWNKGQYVKFEKNENYWDAANVNLDELYIYAVAESSTEITMYETDQLDVTYMTMSTADQTRLDAEGVLNKYSTLMTRYIMVNNDVVSDAKVRNALLLALDLKVLAENVVTNSVACGGFIPNDMAAVDNPANKFRTESYIPESGDVEKAQQLLAEAGYPNGEGFPTDWELIYTTGEANKALAEAIVEMWKQNLGINIVAANLEGTVRRDRKNTGDFEFSLDGWSTDYLDPYSFLEICISDNQYNNGKYNNPEFDALCETAKFSADQTVRQQAMAEAEKILVEDMGVMPLYNGMRTYLQKDYVSGIVRSLLGQIDFKWADVNK